MPLLSRLFQDDPALEAAAQNDAAHITSGQRGAHVRKIQIALNVLDGAGLTVDGIYGPATAEAVLNYKTDRNIVNQAYQTAADNIVGKMTVAKLDQELLARQVKPRARIELIPVSPSANWEKAYPRFHLKTSDTGDAAGVSDTGKAKTLVAAPKAPIIGVTSITISAGQTAEILVKNGDGCALNIHGQFYSSTPWNPYVKNAKLIVPWENGEVEYTHVKGNDVAIKVKALLWGTAILEASEATLTPQIPEPFERMVINIQDPRPLLFHPTDAHHHEPVQEPDEWNKVCEEAEKDPDLGFTLTRLAKIKASPETVAQIASMSLAGNDNAQLHYRYYLGGQGGVVNEDALLKTWIERDNNARTVISRRIRDARAADAPTAKLIFEFSQLSYDDNDARNSFGTIDKLEVLADFVMGTVEIWFEDTYEWHPPYSQYTKPMKCPNPSKRDTNFGHAALVQMKKRGAKDFQMRGYAKFPMKIFPNL